MAQITYEYHSKGSPVVMYEKVNGYTVALYTAYIDRHGNGWWLYPKERIRVSNVKFEKKYVSIMKVTILPPPKPFKISPSREEKKQNPSADEQQTLL